MIYTALFSTINRWLKPKLTDKIDFHANYTQTGTNCDHMRRLAVFKNIFARPWNENERETCMRARKGLIWWIVSDYIFIIFYNLTSFYLHRRISKQTSCLCSYIWVDQVSSSGSGYRILLAGHGTDIYRHVPETSEVSGARRGSRSFYWALRPPLDLQKSSLLNIRDFSLQ